MQMVTVGNPMDMTPLSSGTMLLAIGAAQGITGGTLYLLMSNGYIWEMIPQSQWAANGVVPNSTMLLNLYATFGPPPTSEAWGNYINVGEIKFYLQNPQITGPLTLKQLLGIS